MKPATDRTTISRESAAGLVLLGAALLALIIANSPLYAEYERWLAMPLSLGKAPIILSKPLLLWINDGLMAVFFFLVGLEIKREMLRGALSTRARRSNKSSIIWRSCGVMALSTRKPSEM